jgi:hypothetical protein
MTHPSVHTFNIPVMGLAYTIDSPIRVAHLGISSVISIMDDELIEKMNAFYSRKFNWPYQEINSKTHDGRALRITSYLNLVDTIVKLKFDNFKKELSENKDSLMHFIAMLPNKSTFKEGLMRIVEGGITLKDTVKKYLEENFSAGDIDVNIMTKVDKDNYENNVQLPIEFNDAHAALRGFVNSNLSSSVVLSAGMNPRLYSYFEHFDDFFPNENGFLKKKIILKVSDFRSAMIQGNFLAKKGLWVSEYRIESGLNCGGHAFATEGLLMGPILEEFKEKKGQLIDSAHELMVKSLTLKGKPCPEMPLPLKITAQGGVGTAEEHSFLLEHYQLNAVGWGSPFLLVPEATAVDAKTRALLKNAKEDDFYLSYISPLGIPFNTLKGTTNEFWKQKRMNENKAGSSCPKGLLALSKELDDKGICTASKKYQDVKLSELYQSQHLMGVTEFEKLKTIITEKSCLCVGLVNAAYLENDIKIKGQEQGVVICPGPNLAYFNEEISLSDMVKHIYGNANVMNHVNRPHVFIKELQLYIAYLKNDISDVSMGTITSGQIKKWHTFSNNLSAGIQYYMNLFGNSTYFKTDRLNIQPQLIQYQSDLNEIKIPEPIMA